MESTRAYRTVDVALALLAAIVVEVAIYVVFATHVELRSLKVDKPPPPQEVAIAVQPILDELPLLKLGSKKKYKLPPMWRKRPPPEKQFKDVTAASTKADKELPDKPVETDLAKADEEIPPEDAKSIKETDEEIDEKEDIDWDEEGHEDGVAEGTETDPLKAFRLSQYRSKIIAWFKSGFSYPEIDCGTLRSLNIRIAASVSQDRTVTGFTVTGASGNSTFDSRVKAHMQSKVGQQHPPPPPSDPEFWQPTISLNFSGENVQCTTTKLRPPSPDTAPDEEPPDESPADPAPKPEFPEPDAPEPDVPERAVPEPEIPKPPPGPAPEPTPEGTDGPAGEE